MNHIGRRWIEQFGFSDARPLGAVITPFLATPVGVQPTGVLRPDISQPGEGAGGFPVVSGVNQCGLLGELFALPVIIDSFVSSTVGSAVGFLALTEGFVADRWIGLVVASGLAGVLSAFPGWGMSAV